MLPVKAIDIPRIPWWWEQASPGNVWQPSPNQTQIQTQMAGPMDWRIVIYISVNKRRVTHLDTSTYQNVDFLTSNLTATPKLKPTDERMKWQQYPSASMWAEGKSSEYISMQNFMPFLPCALSANEHKPEKAVNERTDGGQTGGRMERQTGGLREIPMSPQLGTGQDVVRNENWKNVLK